MGNGLPAAANPGSALGNADATTAGTVSDDAAAPPLVRIRGLHFARAGKVIFDGVDMDIPRGAVTAIMGPSGTGKTTLPGSVVVDGENVHRLGRRGLYALRTRMGMLFQSGALLGDLSVFDNVAYPLREHARLPAALLRRLLRGAAYLMPAQLSGGMARRVALARAVALDPMMVMYDEPFTGQDPISMGVLVSLVRHLNDAGGLSSIIVSHDVPETLSIADYVYVIAEGRHVDGSGTAGAAVSGRAAGRPGALPLPGSTAGR